VSTAELWSAVADLVENWVRSPHVEGIREELWKDLDSNEAIRPLRVMALRDPQDIRSMPLAVYKAFPHMGIELTPRDLQFMAHSLAVEKAIVYLMWAVRSKLPGFPMIAAPQLAKGSRLTMDNFTPPWTREVMQSGFQYQDLAPRINAAVEVDSRAPLARLLAAFNTLPSWHAFKAAQDSLTSALRSELLAARRTITERAITENDATEIDSDDPWMRIKRARASADEVIAGLTPDAQAYSGAFDRINDEIDLAIANVITSLIAFGPPDTLAGVGGLNMLATQPLTVTFQLEGPALAHTGRVYWTDDSLVTDALYVNGFHYAGDQIHGGSFAFDATVLVGSNTAWRSTVP
jgi:hypothetical protein